MHVKWRSRFTYYWYYNSY